MNKFFTIPIRRVGALVLILVTLLFPFPTQAQNISLKKLNISLASLFVELNRLSGFDFVYDFELIEKVGRINVDVKQEPLSSVLDQVLAEKGLEYTITGNIVTITAKNASKSVSTVSVPA